MTDMIEDIDDCLLEYHMALMQENAAMRQQLADALNSLEVSKNVANGNVDAKFEAWRQLDLMEQQLAAALAACKVKDWALDSVKSQRIDGHLFPAVVDMNAWHTKVINALAIQPDDSALMAWLGEPVAWMTTDEEGSPAMLFFDKQEASMFSDCDDPFPLYAKNVEPT